MMLFKIVWEMTLDKDRLIILLQMQKCPWGWCSSVQSGLNWSKSQEQLGKKLSPAALFMSLLQLGPSWDPLCHWWTSQPYSVMSPIPLLSFCIEPASRLWNSPRCALSRDYQGIRRTLPAAKDSSAFCKIYSVSGTWTLCFAWAVSKQAVNAVWRSELLSQQGRFSLLPSDCPHQPHLSPAALPAARCRAGSLGLYQGSALVMATYHCLKSHPVQSCSPRQLCGAKLKPAAARTATSLAMKIFGRMGTGKSDICEMCYTSLVFKTSRKLHTVLFLHI